MEPMERDNHGDHGVSSATSMPLLMSCAHPVYDDVFEQSMEIMELMRVCVDQARRNTRRRYISSSNP